MALLRGIAMAMRLRDEACGAAARDSGPRVGSTVAAAVAETGTSKDPAERAEMIADDIISATKCKSVAARQVRRAWLPLLLPCCRKHPRERPTSSPSVLSVHLPEAGRGIGIGQVVDRKNKAICSHNAYFLNINFRRRLQPSADVWTISVVSDSKAFDPKHRCQREAYTGPGGTRA